MGGGGGPNSFHLAPRPLIFISGLAEFRGRANSVSAVQLLLFVCQSELTEFLAELT